MNQELILKMAQVQTLLDAIKLLEYLRQETSSQHWPDIDNMVLRLTNMGQTLAP